MVGRLRSILSESPKLTDDIIDQILFSPRPTVNALLYDEVIELVNAIAKEFSEIV